MHAFYIDGEPTPVALHRSLSFIEDRLDSFAAKSLLEPSCNEIVLRFWCAGHFVHLQSEMSAKGEKVTGRL